MIHKLIQQLASIPGLRIQCPECKEDFPVADGKLFSMYDTYPPAARQIVDDRQQKAKQLDKELKKRKRKLHHDKQNKPKRITVSAKAVNFGQIAEQILPGFITFPYTRSECRVLLKPVDYIVFTHLSHDGIVETIKVVDAKTGNARLERGQKQIRDCISEGKIKHEVLP
jgi:predicted Holliday junction resolvase-like endonuclease